MQNNTGYEAHVKWMPQRAFNAYPQTSCDAVAKEPEKLELCLYHPGDFLIHFPAHSGADWFPAVVRQYYKQATGLDGISVP
jgi:hypothetical protein